MKCLVSSTALHIKPRVQLNEGHINNFINLTKTLLQTTPLKITNYDWTHVIIYDLSNFLYCVLLRSGPKHKVLRQLFSASGVHMVYTWCTHVHKVVCLHQCFLTFFESLIPLRIKRKLCTPQKNAHKQEGTRRNNKLPPVHGLPKTLPLTPMGSMDHRLRTPGL